MTEPDPQRAELAAHFAANQREIDADAAEWHKRARAAAETSIRAQIGQWRKSGVRQFALANLEAPTLPVRYGTATVQAEWMIIVLDELTAAGILADNGGGRWSIR